MFGQGFSFSGYERDPLYLNLGGKKFTDISGVSGIDSITDGRAGVFADFDNDGDLDVFSTTIQNQAHLLFRNNVGQDNNFLRIGLQGDKQTGFDAFGAVVRVKTSAGILTKIKSGGSGFISQHDARLLFGLGKDPKVEWIEVAWANGAVERFAADAATAGSTLLLKKGSGKAQLLALGKASLPNSLTKAEIFAQSLKIKVGSPLPDLAVKTMNGAASSVRKQFKPGRSTLINVWATWCVPCAKEMPELQRMRLPLAARGVDLIGINVDTEKGANIKGYIAAKRVTYPNLIGSVAAIEQIYATDELSVPLTILVDDKGIVVELIPGWSAETQRKFNLLVGGEAVKSDIPIAPAKANKKR
jgi:thiol-disulfide isomerase/thioredoxin